jgi:hypothetical protein
MLDVFLHIRYTVMLLLSLVALLCCLLLILLEVNKVIHELFLPFQSFINPVGLLENKGLSRWFAVLLVSQRLRRVLLTFSFLVIKSMGRNCVKE